MSKNTRKRRASKAGQRNGRASDASLEWLRADSLTIDPEYQRPLSLTQVRHIADNFDPDALNTLTVSRRGDGELVLLDGQQRHGAVMHMGWGKQLVPCTVYEGLSESDEAAIFTKLNVHRTRPMPFYIFRARVKAGDTEAIAVQGVIENAGLRVRPDSGDMQVTAVTAAETIYRVGRAPLLNWVLKVGVEAWGGNRGAFGAATMLGLASFHKAFPNVPRGALVKKLKRHEPRELESRARQLKALEGGTTGILMARAMVGAYNWRTADGNKLDASVVNERVAGSGLGRAVTTPLAQRKKFKRKG